MTTTLGFIAIDNIAKQLAMTARLQGISAADMTTFDDSDWKVLAHDAFGIDKGDVRVAVLALLLDAESTTTLLVHSAAPRRAA